MALRENNSVAQIQSHDLWLKTNETLSEHEKNSNELTLLVQTAKGQLDSITAETAKVNSMKGDVDAKIVENEKAISAAFAEKENLCARNVKASEELGVLNRQLRLLSSALADAKRRLDRENVAFQKELASQRARLHAVVTQSVREG